MSWPVSPSPAPVGAASEMGGQVSRRGESAGWLRIRHTELESHGKVTGVAWIWSSETDGNMWGPGKRWGDWLP